MKNIEPFILDWRDGWNEGRQQAIRDCIAAVEAVADYLPNRPAESLVNLPATLAALRALLTEGSE